MEYELQKLFYDIKKLQEKENNIVEGFKKANLLDNKVAVQAKTKSEAYHEVLKMLIPILEEAKHRFARDLEYVESLRNEIKKLKGEQE